MEPGLAVAVGIADFGCEGGALLLHWMFSFKYWVISLEIPKAIRTSASDFQSSEKKYKVYDAIGITINLLTCAWLAVRRGQLDYATSGRIQNEEQVQSLTTKVTRLYYAVTFLELFSGVVLADALRRIQN